MKAALYRNVFKFLVDSIILHHPYILLTYLLTYCSLAGARTRATPRHTVAATVSCVSVSCTRTLRSVPPWKLPTPGEVIPGDSVTSLPGSRVPHLTLIASTSAYIYVTVFQRRLVFDWDNFFTNMHDVLHVVLFSR